jgi:hypothetical protein
MDELYLSIMAMVDLLVEVVSSFQEVVVTIHHEVTIMVF